MRVFDLTSYIKLQKKSNPKICNKTQEECIKTYIKKFELKITSNHKCFLNQTSGYGQPIYINNLNLHNTVLIEKPHVAMQSELPIT